MVSVRKCRTTGMEQGEWVDGWKRGMWKEKEKEELEM
jgi:hypothetical protein